MTKKQKAEIVQSTLERLYPAPPIPLKHKDPFTLLISVLLSAQTTDAMVNRVTPALFAVADTPKKMMHLSPEQIREFIKACGLAPQKSKAIKELSRILMEKHHGDVPANFDDLEALPGVGHKTASVVMAQAFGVPAFPVDTHIHRLAYRWGLSNGKNVLQTEKDLKALFPKDKWNQLHLQIIYFGREHCPARNHVAETCPLCSKIGVKSRLGQNSKKT
ncbi:MAG: endonuclease III [Deferribacteres bacterium]|nr:endonuclease III [candidate division KSB1 bacterium]MCB9512669.1 endonuclease III [Deferribacteres bacterium]